MMAGRKHWFVIVALVVTAGIFNEANSQNISPGTDNTQGADVKTNSTQAGVPVSTNSSDVSQTNTAPSGTNGGANAQPVATSNNATVDQSSNGTKPAAPSDNTTVVKTDNSSANATSAGGNSTTVSTGTANSTNATVPSTDQQNTTTTTTNTTTTNTTTTNTTTTNTTTTNTTITNTTTTNTTTTNTTTTNTTTTNTTTTNTTTTDTTTTTTPTTTTAKDYCASSPCIHGNCTNSNSYYTCSCLIGWTGSNCETKLVLWPDYKGMGVAGNITAVCKQNFLVPVPFFERTVTDFYGYSNGYAAFGSQLLSDKSPIGTEWPDYPSLFGVYWTPINIPVGGDSTFYCKQIEDRLQNATYTNDIFKYIQESVNDTNFEPVTVAIMTWINVLPKSAANTSTDKASFQLIIASDTRLTYTIKNYQRVWTDTLSILNGRAFISASYSGANGMRQSADIPNTTIGPLVVKLFSDGTPNKDPLTCVQNALNLKTNLQNSINALPVCPCFLPQIQTNAWFENINMSCYRTVLAYSGLQRMCCYNRFGLLINNTKNTLPDQQSNATEPSIQTVFTSCSYSGSRLTNWFLSLFPLPDCNTFKSYVSAWLIGSTNVVMFSGTMFTFTSLGDFVLFKSGDVEIQARFCQMAGSNAATLQAVAIKAGNTSSYQIYWASTEQKWNYQAIGDVTYKVVQTLQNITLVLPKFSFIITNKNNVATCQIQTNIGTSLNNAGLLGTLNASSVNNFLFSNGTSVLPAGGPLGSATLQEFVNSWKVQNATMSLFTYPGSVPCEETNTTLILKIFATNVSDVLDKFTNDTDREAAQKLCGQNYFCLSQYILNGSDSANEVLQQTQASQLDKPTNITAPEFIKQPSIVVLPTSPYTTILRVVNDVPVEFSIDKEDFPDIKGISLNMNNFTWNVSTDLQVLRSMSYPRSLKFYATNSNKVSGEYVPTVMLCLCEKTNQCLQDLSYTNNDGLGSGNVNNLLCQCGDMFGGKFCEKPEDFCGNCFNRSTCNNSTTSQFNYCGACPSGYMGDGKVCDDIDECAISNGNCDQMCSNSPGSFSCSCKAGYMANGLTCSDINECQDVNVCKVPLTTCINLPGSFSCPCLPGLVGKNQCIYAPYKYLGYTDITVMWDARLDDVQSDLYQSLADKVTSFITDALITGGLSSSESFVDVLDFQILSTTRTKRDTSPTTNQTRANFVVYTSNSVINASQLNTILNNYFSANCSQNCSYEQLVVVSSPDLKTTGTLCSYPQIHKCNLETTVCSEAYPQTSCTCKSGFEKKSDPFSCDDMNECAGNLSQICPETKVCANTFGSYKCDCNVSQYWDVNTTKCVADGCSTNPCKSGVCKVVQNSQQYVCSCNSGWYGTNCENEDTKAKSLEIAVICVSVILGVCCLVLLIILIIMCCRHYRAGSDWTLESDSYTNSRYNDVENLPRAKLTHRTATEMSENGRSYDRLDYANAHDKQTTFGHHAPTSRNEGMKNVYDNRAYEGGAGERL